MRAVCSFNQKSCKLVVAVCVLGLTASTFSAMEGPEVSGKVLDVSVRIQPAGHSMLPNIKEIGDVSVDLMENGSNLYAASDAPAGSSPITIKVKQLRGYQLSASAADTFQQAIVQQVNDLGIGGVSVLFETPKQGAAGRARINVLAGTVEKVNTKSVNKAADTPAADDTPSSNDAPDEVAPKSGPVIEKGSPILVGGVEPALLAIDELNEYLSKLNRFPGRQVTTAISAGENPGTLLLDYLVDEETFSVYAQASNTGTDTTSKWIERFGIFASQLSGNDDMLNVEGTTGNFKNATRSINAYYDSRLGNEPDWRYRVTGTWGDYTAADVGFLAQDFTGSTHSFQGDLIWNFYQDGNFFLDLDIGMRYWNAKAKSELWGWVLSDGESDFITPSISISAFDLQEDSVFQATLGANYTSADGDQSQLNQLGRLNTNEEWWTLYGSTQLSFFIDSLFDSSVEEMAVKPMVNEITIRGQGQYAFGDRLTPTAMSTMGGYYTVRGYPQSVISGDSSVQGTVEYRFHLPRAIASEPAGKGIFGDNFRWTRDSDTGAAPDWDLALLGFFDAGCVWQSEPYSFEDDSTTLLGAGVGVELSIRENISLSLNYGWALKDLPAANVEDGDDQIYFLGSINF